MPDLATGEYDPMRPVGASRQVLGTSDAFSLWFSLGIGLLVLQTGALLVPGLGVAAALGAVLAGTAIGVGLLAAAGIVGAETGLSSMATLRPALGVRGASLAALLNALQLLGWGAFEIIAMRDAAAALERHWLARADPGPLTLFFGAVTAAMAAAGPLSGLRRFLRTWGFGLVLLAALLFSVELALDPRLAASVSRPGDGSLGFAAAVDIVVALPISWLPLISDYTRFGRSPGAMGRGAFLGNALGSAWFCAMGVGFACVGAGEGHGDDALLLPALAGGLSGLPLLLILVDETENAFADIHSAAVSARLLAGAGRRGLLRPGVGPLSAGFGIAATLLALALPLGRYQGFLLLLGSIFAPLFGVLLCDHFVLRRRRVDPLALLRRGGAYWFAGGFRITALAAWALGIATYQAVERLAPSLGATIPSVLVAALAHAALARAVPEDAARAGAPSSAVAPRRDAG